MNPLLDHFLVCAALAGALAYLAFRQWRKRANGKGCAGGCCSSKTDPLMNAATNEVTLKPSPR